MHSRSVVGVLEVDGAPVAQRTVQAPAIVERFDIIKDLLAGFLAAVPGFAVDHWLAPGQMMPRREPYACGPPRSGQQMGQCRNPCKTD